MQYLRSGNRCKNAPVRHDRIRSGDILFGGMCAYWLSFDFRRQVRSA
ncbi:hypothetical protein D3OALGB2SA_4728 [Olavius algarvensis associated proteobacterium Delta 3]|nr:hypothetical protein D3OALGB2SA_4728 [Olavius algarvensis associated proteobacterium Delta 3]